MKHHGRSSEAPDSGDGLHTIVCSIHGRPGDTSPPERSALLNLACGYQPARHWFVYGLAVVRATIGTVTSATPVRSARAFRLI